MKKTTLVIALALVLCIVLAGCNNVKKEKADNDYDTGFRVLETFNGSLLSWVVTDQTTGVMYWVNYHGGVTPIINADGSPRIWEGEK